MLHHTLALLQMGCPSRRVMLRHGATVSRGLGCGDDCWLLLLQKEADEDTYSDFYHVQADNGHYLPIMVCILLALLDTFWQPLLWLPPDLCTLVLARRGLIARLLDPAATCCQTESSTPCTQASLVFPAALLLAMPTAIPEHV